MGQQLRHVTWHHHLVVLWVLVWLLATSLGAAAQQARLGHEVRPSEQSVSLKVDPAQESFNGSTEIAIEVDQRLQAIRLHAEDISLDRARLASGEVMVPLTAESQSDGTLVLTAATPIEAGRYRLLLEFSGPFNKRSSGLYKYTDQGIPYLSTQFEMSHARLCFPCFDEPSFKIPYQLTIEAPHGQKVFSNTPEEETTVTDRGVIHGYAQTLPIPSYLVAFAVGPFEATSVPGLSVPGRIVTPQGKLALAGFASKVTPQILAALEAYFGIAYPYQKLDQVAISEFPHGAMENAGMVTYREDILLINERTAQDDTRTTTCMVIAHELAHQWFGNLVTMTWWNDLWLNEAFATWMATKIVNQLYPELEYELNTPQNRVMSLDANLSSKPIRKPIRNEADIFDGLSLAYNKGGAVLNMVERWLGEATFRNGIRAYLDEYRFANAEAADLWSALGKASDKDVESVLKAFTEQSGYPLLSFQVEGHQVTLTQRRFLNAGVSAPEQTWTLPVFLRYGKRDKTARTTVLLDGPSTTVELDFEPDWIFPDDGAVGYFRWQLPPAQLEALLEHKQVLSSREKLALISNLGGLFKAGLVSAGENLEYISPWLADSHPSVVALALATLDSNRKLFVNDKNRAAWGTYLQSSLRPVVDRFGLLSRSGDSAKVKELRPLLLTLLAQELGDSDVIATATSAAQNYLEGSDEVDPALADVYLMIAARVGDVALVESVKEAMLAAADPQRRTTLLTTLGMFAQPEAQQRALDLMLDPAVTASDLRILLRENSVEEPRRQRLFAWMQVNYTALSEKIPTPFLSNILASVGGARDQEQLRSVLDFFAQQPDPTRALARESAKVTEQVESTIEVRERGQASFDTYLSEVTTKPAR